MIGKFRNMKFATFEGIKLLILKQLLMKKFYSIVTLLVVFATSSFAQAIGGNETFKTHDGKTFDLYYHLERGQAVLIDFWYMECGNCLALSPELEKLYQAYNKNAEELVVVGLNITRPSGSTSAANDNAAIETYKQSKSLTFPDCGWEGNVSGSTNKVRAWWGNTFYSIGGSGFTQAYLIIPNVSDPSQSQVEWYQTGYLNNDIEQAVKDELAKHNVRQTWEQTVASVDQQSIANSLSVYPNPAKDVINVQLETSEDAMVDLVDLNGKVVYSNSISGNNVNTISTADFASGIYTLTVTSGSDVSVHKVVIQ